MSMSRMGKSSKATYLVVRNSSALLSDAEQTDANSESDDEDFSGSHSSLKVVNQKSQQSTKKHDLKLSKASASKLAQKSGS